MALEDRVNVLGIGISPINLGSAQERIRTALENKQKGYVCVTGVHGVMEAQSDPALKRILNASFLTTPDGMPMVWCGWKEGRVEMDRVYGPDLMLQVIEEGVTHRWKHFFYGGKEGVSDQLKRNLETRYPGVEIVGTYCPPFRKLNESEIRDLQDRISELKPDVVWVGLSTPKQEHFMAEFLPKLDTTLMFGVGAAFDFHAGLVSQAPHWMQRSGLEWFYRLLMEPKRLWKRYLCNNPRFLLGIFLQWVGLKKHSINP